MRTPQSPTRALQTPTHARFLCLCLCAAGGMPASAEPLDEARGVAAVCRDGPAVAAARARALEGQAGVIAAGVLPNPAIVAEHRRALDPAADEESTVGLSVALGIGGRRFLLEDAAEAKRQQTLKEGAWTRFESALAFREAFVRAVIDRARVEVLRAQQDALDAWAERLAGLRKGGDSGGYDLLREQVHARTHRRVLDLASGRATGSHLALAAFVSPPVELAAVPLGDLGSSSPGPAQLPEHPLALGLEDRARAARLEERAAARRWIPDVEVFVGYRGATTLGADPSRGLALSLRVPITLFDHGQGEQAQAAAEQARSEAARAQLLRERGALEGALRARLEALTAAEAQRTPSEAARLLEQAKALYAAGEMSIAELIDAQRGAEEAQLGDVDWAAEVAELRLARMRAVGSFFDPALDRACGAEEAPR